MRSSLKPWVLAVGLALASQLAPAAGFGKINVGSALGQPLAAEIDLLNVSQDDVAGMQVRLASPDAFREANVEMSPDLASVKFSIEKRPNGQSYIKVTSTQPISEPALNLLVEVVWPSGRLLRDYPVLLNPAGYQQDKAVADNSPRLPAAPPEVQLRPAMPVQPVAPPLAVAPQLAAAPAAAGAAKAVKPAVAPKPAQPGQAKAQAPKAAPAAKPEAPAAVLAGHPGSNYTVQPGDTLRALAYNNRPGVASLEQTMLAMFETNRSAFINDSIHRIRAGKTIHLPNESEATTVAAEEAGKRVNLLASDFEAYRKRLADAAEAKPTSSPAAKAPVTGKLTAQTEDAARPARPGSDVVQVSRSAAAAAAGQAADAGKGKAGGQAEAPAKSAGDDKANQLAEEAVARENQLKEARERVSMLENNLSQMRNLLKKDGQAADAPKTAPEPTPQAEVKPPVEAPEAIKPVAPPVEPAKPAEMEKAAIKPAAENSFLDDVTAQLQDNPLAVGGGVLSGLLVAWLGLRAVRRRRDRAADLFAPSTSAHDPITVDAVTADKGSAMVDTTTGSYSTEFGHVVPDQHHVDEVDPVAEADVYIAYGRDVQAEEILKEAMAKDPDRTEILMKLLEIYAQRKSVAEYAQHAHQLRERVGTSHPLWSAAMAMGYEIDPDNPLYQGAGEEFVPPPAPVPAAKLDHELGVEHAAPAPSHFDGAAAHGETDSGAPHPLAAIGEPASGLPELHPLHEERDTAAAGQHQPLPDAHEHQHQAGHADGENAEAAETLRQLSAISADSLRTVEPVRAAEGNPGNWPNLSEVAAFGGAGLSLAASHKPANHGETDSFALDFDLGEGAGGVPQAASLEHGNAALAHGNAALELGKIDLDLSPDPQPSSPPVLTLVNKSVPLQPVPGEPVGEPRSFGDIDLDLKSVAAAPVATAPHAAVPVTAAAEQSSQWHNVATKLDLARAYLEIGDKDGAREILREVSAEGDEAQRLEAERLAVQI